MVDDVAGVAAAIHHALQQLKNVLEKHHASRVFARVVEVTERGQDVLVGVAFDGLELVVELRPGPWAFGPAFP